VKLDFSQYHPLDHSIRQCSGYPGGRRRHLSHRWQFQIRERLTVAWKHATFRHEWQPFAAKDKVSGEWLYFVDCAGCAAEPNSETKERLIAEMRTRPMPDFNIEE
jgi:hypothetical protein